MGAIRVAIVAESQLFSDGLCQILRSDSSLLIATDDRSVTDTDADVRLLDACAPSTAESLQDVRLRANALPYTIVVNAPETDGWAADALSAGVRGLLSSDATASELLRAIHVVHDGGIWARRRWLIAYVQRATDRRRGPVGMKATTSLDARLSKREREVFRHAATGAGNKELATRLAISEATVKVHMTRIFRKLGLHGRAELAAAYHGLRVSGGDEVVEVVRRLA
jgi:DNA-binding NarL/FixJ family response regulator